MLISVNAVHCAFFAGISVQFNGEHIRCCKSVLESDSWVKSILSNVENLLSF